MQSFASLNAACAVPLSRRHKAAVIVRLLVSEGAEIPLDGLSDEQQADLTEAMGELRTVDRGTLRSVVEEFVSEIDDIGLAFPGGVEGALSVLDGHISAATASRLRRRALLTGRADPWQRLLDLPDERLRALLASEGAEVGAVVLSKLPVERAAGILGLLPGERARLLARAIADVAQIAPETVRRIGLALVQEVEAAPLPAFSDPPVARVGAILSASAAAMRDDVLASLDAQDAEFAAAVRKVIFTFPDIGTRIEARDIPKVVREVDPAMLAAATAAALARGGAHATAVEFLLANISQRMAAQLRQEAADQAGLDAAAGETAMDGVVSAIRELENGGALKILPPKA